MTGPWPAARSPDVGHWPRDDDALKSLYEKIKGKMESAKQLAALITLLLGGLLGVLLDSSKWDGLGRIKTGLPAPFDYSGQGAAQAAFGYCWRRWRCT